MPKGRHKFIVVPVQQTVLVSKGSIKWNILVYLVGARLITFRVWCQCVKKFK